MLLHHEVKTPRMAVLLLAGWGILSSGCTQETLSDTDMALKLTLLHEIEEGQASVAEGTAWCITVLDTARDSAHSYDARWEFDHARESMQQGRMRDPEPWLIPSLRREFFLSPPDIRPLSQCGGKDWFTSPIRDTSMLFIVERIEMDGTNTVVISLQTRSRAIGSHPDDKSTWGQTADHFVERKDGRWHWDASRLNGTI